MVRGVFALSVLSCLTFAFGVRADRQGEERVRALLARLGGVEAFSARFREEKHMALLKAPLVSEGVLYYQKPRLLARHTKSPGASSLVLRGDELRFGDAAKSESMTVSSEPALSVLVDTFVSVLSGDGQALARTAVVRAEALGERGFRISMEPKDPAMAKLVRGMIFEGEENRLTRMELLDANGDRTVTTFHDVEFRARFSDDELARLFRVGG